MKTRLESSTERQRVLRRS